jgi:hypothetical protein
MLSRDGLDLLPAEERRRAARHRRDRPGTRGEALQEISTWGSPALATTTTATGAAVAATGALTTSTGAAVTTPASTGATATATLTGCGLVDADHATHPLHILEVIDGPLLGGVIDQLNKSKATLATCVTVEGQAALANLSVLGEEINQILAFSLEREVADVNGHSIKKPGTDSSDVRVLMGRSVTGRPGLVPL